MSNWESVWFDRTMILAQTLILLAIGVAMGVPAVLNLSPVLDHSLAAPYTKNFLYELQSGDPLTLAAAVLVLFAAAFFTAAFFAGYLRQDALRSSIRRPPFVAIDGAELFVSGLRKH